MCDGKWKVDVGDEGKDVGGHWEETLANIFFPHPFILQQLQNSLKLVAEGGCGLTKE